MARQPIGREGLISIVVLSVVLPILFILLRDVIIPPFSTLGLFLAYIHKVGALAGFVLLTFAVIILYSLKAPASLVISITSLFIIFYVIVIGIIIYMLDYGMWIGEKSQEISVSATPVLPLDTPLAENESPTPTPSPTIIVVVLTPFTRTPTPKLPPSTPTSKPQILEEEYTPSPIPIPTYDLPSTPIALASPSPIPTVPPTPTPTYDLPPTPIVLASPSPIPTVPPTPVLVASVIEFWAGGTTLYWHIKNVKAAYLYGGDLDRHPITGPSGSLEVFPDSATTYVLLVELVTGEIVTRRITLPGEPAGPMLTPTYTKEPTPTEEAAFTPVPTYTKEPTPTSTSTSIVTATATVSPTFTATPISTSTVTATATIFPTFTATATEELKDEEDEE